MIRLRSRAASGFEGERIDASVVDIKTDRRSVPIGKLLLKAKRTGACSRAVI